MFGKDFQRIFIAGIASVLMSTLAIGATVLPVDHVDSPLEQAVYA